MITNGKKPLVSYVVTAYNIEQYISDSINCAFDQTYNPLEIVLSDDCSTDNTFLIMQRMASEYTGPHKIVLNKNECNMGISQHMNKAYLELASGEIIIAAHGDDLSVPERTVKSVEYLLSHPGITAVSGGLKVIDAGGAVLEEQSRRSQVAEEHFYTLDNPIEEGIANIPAPSRAFYKNVFSYFGPLDKSCPTEDELISFRALLLGRNAFIPDVFVSYRKHELSSSNAENFSKFPLEKIRDQQIRDMEYAVSQGILSQEMKSVIEKVTLEGVTKRKLYRAFFAVPSLANLYRLISCPLVGWKGKISYIKEYILRKTGRI